MSRNPLRSKRRFGCRRLSGHPVRPHQVSVRRDRPHAAVLDGSPNREIIKALEAIAGKAEQLVAGIVEVAADACPAYPNSLGLEIEHLPEDSSFPEQAAVPPGTASP